MVMEANRYLAEERIKGKFVGANAVRPYCVINKF
jgi:hypothetical protein